MKRDPNPAELHIIQHNVTYKNQLKNFPSPLIFNLFLKKLWRGGVIIAQQGTLWKSAKIKIFDAKKVIQFISPLESCLFTSLKINKAVNFIDCSFKNDYYIIL